MCPSLCSILRGPSACIITSSSPTKVSKSARNKLKNYFTLTKVPEKESKVGFKRHKLISMFYRRNSMRVRISFADSTRRNNRYRRSFGWIHPTNETNLFALWFSFFTQEQRPFYHDKNVNIKPSKPPCFKKPLTVLRAGSCVLSHCEQFGLSLARITKFVGTHESTTQTSGSSTASSIICQNELSVL